VADRIDKLFKRAAGLRRYPGEANLNGLSADLLIQRQQPVQGDALEQQLSSLRRRNWTPWPLGSACICTWTIRLGHSH
jgi:hypothetical protein